MRLEHGAFNGLRLFHLHDHFSGFEDLCCGREDGGACGCVFRVRCTNTHASGCLNNDFMAVGHELADAVRGQANAVFTVFDFFWNANDHGSHPFCNVKE